MTKRQAPAFSQLPRRQQMAIASALQHAMSAVSLGGSYDAVSGQTAKQRAPSIIEIGGEDEVLSSWNRNKLTNMMRQQMRNGPLGRIIDQQRRVHVVGLSGGKLTITTENDEFNEAVQTWFNEEWAPCAEFTDGLHFNETLKLVISSLDNGGDMVAVFDDDLFDDSGRIRAFESDEIGNIPEGEFSRRFAARGWKQSQGRIADRFGRTIGVIVSTAQRGLAEFDPAKAFILTRDPSADPRDAHFVYSKASWRFNQGRGVSPRTAAVNTMIDMYELLGSETQAAKLNAKLFGQLMDSSDIPSEDSVPPEYRPTEADPTGDAEPSDGLTTQEEIADNSQPPVTFEALDAIGAVYDMMPPKIRWELIDTKRPNEKVIDFVNFNAGLASGVHGLGRVYATLNPESSYTAFRGAQCLSWPSIEEAQKDLERKLCDWAGRQAVKWGLSRGRIAGVKVIPANWQRSLSWMWPEMKEVNEVDSETAFQKKLQNLVTTFRDKFGPNWKVHLKQAADEIAWCRENNILHPALQTVSGGVLPQQSNQQKETGK